MIELSQPFDRCAPAHLSCVQRSCAQRFIAQGRGWRRVRGQALILFMVSLLVLCVGAIVLFNTGQAVTKKTELVNAADAAAYSAAVQQARAYNLIAYMNRASVANEIAVAQMVSWYSWMNFTLSATDHFKDAVQTIAIVFDVTVVLVEVGAALQEVVSVLNSVKNVVTQVRNGMQIAFSAAATIISAADNVYSKASFAIATVGRADVIALADTVVKRNTDGKAKIGARGLALLGVDVLEAGAYSKRYTIPGANEHSKPDADRYTNVVMEARDGFSRSRNGGIGINIPGVLSFQLNKRGGTDLVNYHRWVGMDTLNLRVKFGCIPLAGCKLKGNIPFAWGGAAGVDSSDMPASFRAAANPGINGGAGWTSPYEIDPGHYQRYSGALDNGNAGSMALRYPAQGGNGDDKAWIKNHTSKLFGQIGLLDYNDVADNKATVPYLNGKSAAQNGVKALDVGPIFTVLVEQPMDTVHTSSHVQGIGGPPDFSVPDNAVDDSMTALSSAQAYFSRPRSLFRNIVSPSSRETGNLFSPYWQARLIDTPCLVRQKVAVAYGALTPCL